MGDLRQFKIVRTSFSGLPGPVLEVGSKNYGNTPDFRPLFPSNEYIGVDMQEGQGVDLQLDLTEGLGPLAEQHFALVICCSVLEHTPRPWRMAENICRLLRDGGHVYISVPWIFPFHGYPNDYFRFSPAGVKSLFPDMEWTSQVGYSGPKGAFFDCTKEGFDLVCKTVAVDPASGGPVAAWKKCMINLVGRLRRPPPAEGLGESDAEPQ